jgi:hypothetical protein
MYPVNRDSYKQIKKFAHFESECKHFDAVLNDLQLSLYHHCHTNDDDFDVYEKAQLVRDTLFRLMRKMRGVPNEDNPDDFDCAGGDVLET